MNRNRLSQNFLSLKKTFIIAEISANHGGKISNLKKLIRKCKLIGVDGVKIQTYEPGDLTLKSNKSDFKLKNDSPWSKFSNTWDLYDNAKTPDKWLKEVFAYAKKQRIPIFSSPFSERAVALLEKFQCPIYKLASPEINHIPLIEQIAKTQKPIIISTGLANHKDIILAIKTFRNLSNKKIILLKCTTEYPCLYKNVNLNHIIEMQKKYKVDVGLSDHTLGIEVPIAAVALGAKVIEKHICLNKNIDSADNFFSLDVGEFKKMIISIRNTEKALFGKKLVNYKISKKQLLTRRSLYFSKNLNKNQIITKHDIKIIRPGYGLSPKDINRIIGMSVAKNVEIGDRVTLSSVKKT